jgi:hypothetical protein
MNLFQQEATAPMDAEAAQSVIEAPEPETAPALYIQKPSGNIQPLIRDDGMIDLASMSYAERIQSLEAEFPRDAFNLVHWDQHILATVPKGAYLVPNLVRPDLADCWHGPEAEQKIKIKAGHVEPRAEFYNKIGQGSGVRLKMFFRGVTELNNVAMYEVLYIAYAMMPWGILQTEPVGKAQPLYNANGVAAHIIENTDKKARRNAYKAFLNLQTTYEKERFLLPWVPAQFAYKKGESADVDLLIAEQSERAQMAKDLLFPTQAKQIAPAGMSGDQFDKLKEDIGRAETPAQLQDVADRIAKGGVSEAQRSELIPLYRARKRRVETGEITPPASAQTVDTQAAPAS